jgi:HNH endonuclease
VLYRFSGSDGASPGAGLIADKGGALYGTTALGGTGASCPYATSGCGTVFKLTPLAKSQSTWPQTVLYSFCSLSNCSDGVGPGAGLIADKKGALYSTTYNGGSSCPQNTNVCGTVFKLAPPPKGQSKWTETVFYRFSGSDGANPGAGLTEAGHALRHNGRRWNWQFQFWHSFRNSLSYTDICRYATEETKDDDFEKKLRHEYEDIIPPPLASDIAEIVADIAEIEGDPNIPDTDRPALVKARVGQGLFRDKLLDRWENKCAVTGCTVLQILRASHMKPWRESTNFERLDPANGLLLTAHFDALFDKELISFTDDGEMLVYVAERHGTLGNWVLILGGIDQISHVIVSVIRHKLQCLRN